MRASVFAVFFAIATAFNGASANVLRARQNRDPQCGVTGDAPLAACRALDLVNVNTDNTCSSGPGRTHHVLSCASLPGSEGGGPLDCCVYSTVNNWRPEILQEWVGKILDGCGAPDNADQPGGTVNGLIYPEGGERICIGNGDGCSDCES